MLVVTLNRIEPNRDTPDLAHCWLLMPWIPRSSDRPESGRPDRKPGASTKRKVSRARPRATRPGALEVPLLRMLGCVGTAPRNKEAVSTSTHGSVGGNMDYAGIVAGVKVMLPVYEPGAGRTSSSGADGKLGGASTDRPKRSDDVARTGSTGADGYRVPSSARLNGLSTRPDSADRSCVQSDSSRRRMTSGREEAIPRTALLTRSKGQATPASL